MRDCKLKNARLGVMAVSSSNHVGICIIPSRNQCITEYFHSSQSRSISNVPYTIFFPTFLGFSYSPKWMMSRPSLLILSSSRMLIWEPIPTGTNLIPSFLTSLTWSFTRSFSCRKHVLWSVKKIKTCQKKDSYSTTLRYRRFFRVDVCRKSKLKSLLILREK